MASILSSSQIIDVLRKVTDPSSGKDLVVLNWIANIQIQAGKVSFDVHVASSSENHMDTIRAECIKVVKAVPGVVAVMPNMRKKPKPRLVHGSQAIPGVNHVIVVGSGKGGVGKSTSSVNIALALKKLGYRVGLMDADIYGPSVPTMLAASMPQGEAAEPKMLEGQIVPFELHGIKVISLGLLIAKDQPTVWRAPMATKMIQQFLGGVHWGELDFLIVDLPPGTGDIQLTLSQQQNLSGSIVITTPQKVALDIAKKGLLMFKHVGVPILGIIETMSGFGCSECNHVTPIFGEGGAKKLAAETQIPLLGQIPIDANLVKACDEGEPIVIRDPRAASAQAYMQTAQKIVAAVEASDKADSEDIVPVALEGIPGDVHHGNRVAVFWSDGQKYVYEAKHLRFMCPCAVCVDEFSGERKITESSVDGSVFLDKALPVGRYGVNLFWSDKHTTGIYTYKYLRELEATKTFERPPAPAPSPAL